MEHGRIVGIFWDIENCNLATGFSSGYRVAERITTIAQNYGVINTFKAYLELSSVLPTKESTLQLRSELQTSGVSLTDCPHNGSKDVADKMMIADMLCFAMDHPTSKTTIVLISGDRDFAYVLSALKARKFSVVVITQGNAHVSLRMQATTAFNWNSDVLFKNTDFVSSNSNLIDFSQIPAEPHIVSHTLPSVTESMDCKRPIPISEPTPVVVEPLPPPSSVPVDRAHSPLGSQSSTIDATGNPQDLAEVSASNDIAHATPSPSTWTDVDAGSSKESTVETVPEEESASETILTTVAEDVQPEFPAMVEEIHFPQQATPVEVFTTEHASWGPSSPYTGQSLPLFGDFTVPEEVFNLPGSASYSENSQEIPAQSQHVPTSEDIRRFWQLVLHLRSARTILEAPVSSSTLRSELLAKKPRLCNDSRVGNFESYLTTAEACGLIRRDISKSDHMVYLIDYPLLADDPAFEPLLKCLDGFQKKGINKPSWSDIGPELNVRAYKRAGVMQLRRYLELAQSAGLVNINVDRQWVRIRKRVNHPSISSSETLVVSSPAPVDLPTPDTFQVRRFWPLVAHLRRVYSHGQHAVGMRDLNGPIREDTYSAVGAPDVPFYVALAQAAGLVTTDGFGAVAGPRVSLKYYTVAAGDPAFDPLLKYLRVKGRGVSVLKSEIDQGLGVPVYRSAGYGDVTAYLKQAENLGIVGRTSALSQSYWLAPAWVNG